MSKVVIDRPGSVQRSLAGEVETKLFLYRDGKKVTSESGNDDLSSFVRGFEVYESISSCCMEARIIIEDSAGVFQSFTGSEEFSFQINSSIIDRTYFF